MQDLFFKTSENVFSFRVGGILHHEGKILLQKLMDEEGYAIPGGHVSFGETGQDALKREFFEELHAEIQVERPVFVGEVFIPWGRRSCHQLNLYYLVSLSDPKQIAGKDVLSVCDHLDGQEYSLQFQWIPLDKLDEIVVYPTSIQPLLAAPPEGITHFIYRE